MVGRLRKVSKLLSLLLVISLALGSIGFAAKDNNNGNSAAAHDQKIVARVDAERAIKHIRYLSEEIGPRNSGLAGEDRAAKYIGTTLSNLGLEVEYQHFPVADQYIGRVSFMDGTVWEMGAAPNGKFTESSEFSPVIYVNGGTNITDFPANVSGKIVLMTNASSTALYRQQVENAVQLGAKGVILQSLVGSRGNYGSAFNPSLTKSYDVPVFGAAYIHGEWLKEQLEDGDIEISLSATRYSNLQSTNVIATKPAKNKKSKDKDKVIVLGAHLDSVVGAPGANDNASGTGLMLELARVMKSYQTDKEIKFIAFGSEERGLLGSRYYVNQLSQAERDNIEAAFIADMVATNYDKAENLYAMTVDGSLNIVTQSSESAGARLGNSAILPGTFGSSDHVPFHQAGIPAALFIWMGIDSWNPLIYHIEKVYHTPQDTIEDNISVERMQTALDIIGSAVFDVIQKDVSDLKR